LGALDVDLVVDDDVEYEDVFEVLAVHATPVALRILKTMSLRRLFCFV
jgi:hypothetical protein